MSNDRNILNRRIMNLLTVCKSYLDQIPQNLENIFGKSSPIQTNFKNDTHEFYDNDFGYRFMEALRNHTQHHGVPVHIIGYPSQIDDIDDSESGISFRAVPYTRYSEIVENKKIKLEILDELSDYSQDDRIDIRPFIRSYVECLGKIHINLRNNSMEDVNIWDQNFNNAYKIFKSSHPDIQFSMLSLFHKENNSSLIERIPLPVNIINRRTTFEKKNSLFINMRRYYISNHI